MRRKTILLVWAGGAIWLSAHRFIEPLQRAIAEDVVKKNVKAAEPKDQPAVDESKVNNPKPLAAKQKPKAEKVNAAKAKAQEAKAKKADVEKEEMKKAKAKADVKAAFGALFRVFGARENPVPAVVIDVAVPDNDPNFKQFMQQHGGRVRHLIRTEMHFIRIVCQPTKQQYEKIAAEGETVVKSTIRKYAQKQQQQRMGRGRVVAGQISDTDDPRKLVAEELMKSVQATLSAEQTARYRKELDLRAAAGKRVVLLNVLAKLDEKLVLTAEQRSKLHETIDGTWSNSWSLYHVQTYGENYFPQLPNNKVLTILNETQKTVWNGIPKISNIFIGANALQMIQQVEIEDEKWDDEQPRGGQGTADAEAAAKTEPKTETKK